MLLFVTDEIDKRTSMHGHLHIDWPTKQTRAEATEPYLWELYSVSSLPCLAFQCSAAQLCFAFLCSALFCFSLLCTSSHQLNALLTTTSHWASAKQSSVHPIIPDICHFFYTDKYPWQISSVHPIAKPDICPKLYRSQVQVESYREHAAFKAAEHNLKKEQNSLFIH